MNNLQLPKSPELPKSPISKNLAPRAAFQFSHVWLFLLQFQELVEDLVPDQNFFTVGLIQMHCSADPDDNVRRAVEKVRSAAKQGAQMVCLPELFRTQYFCQREDAALFDLAEPIPGPQRSAFGCRPRNKKSQSWYLFSSGARAASTTTPPSFLTPTAAPRASIARCTSRTILSITRSSISPRATRL